LGCLLFIYFSLLPPAWVAITASDDSVSQMSRADDGIYPAKQLGGNRVIWQEDA